MLQTDRQGPAAVLIAGYHFRRDQLLAKRDRRMTRTLQRMYFRLPTLRKNARCMHFSGSDHLDCATRRAIQNRHLALSPSQTFVILPESVTACNLESAIWNAVAYSEPCRFDAFSEPMPGNLAMALAILAKSWMGVGWEG